MAFKEKTIDSRIVYEGPIFKIRKHTIEAVSGKISERDVLEHCGGAVMLAVKDDGKIIMEEQYRKPIDSVALEIPAGKCEEGEDPLETARRELREETGYSASDVRHLISFNTSFGYSDEVLHIYICKGLTCGERDLDETEDIDIKEFTADELVDMVMNNEISDAKTIIAILYASMKNEI